MLLSLLLCALGCKSGTGGGGSMHAGAAAAAGGAPPAAPEAPGASAMGGNAAAPVVPSGSGGGPAAAGTEVGGTAVPAGPTDSGVQPPVVTPDAAPTGPSDAAAAPLDAGPPKGQEPDCPPVLPDVYAVCPREGLMCEYGMECCPDFAWCEFGQWTVLTHHCDACI